MVAKAASEKGQIKADSKRWITATENYISYSPLNLEAYSI